MPNAATGGSVAQVIKANPLVESILALEVPNKQLWDSMQVVWATSAKPFAEPPESQKLKVRRAELLALPHAELQSLHAELRAKQKRQEEAHAAAVEAARFYNQPQAQPNFAFWLKADFWPFDDAIALLLGKNPKVVTWQAVDAAVNPKGFFKPAPVRSNFLTSYMTLRDLALRSDVMTSGPKLRPVDVATWAMRRLGLTLPEPLRALVSPDHAQQQSALAAPANPVVPPSATHAGDTTAKANAIVHSTKALRRDALAPVIEQAQAGCADPFDVAAVWARLQVMAEQRVPPLIGSTEEGLQYLDQGDAAILNRKALSKRLARAKGRA